MQMKDFKRFVWEKLKNVDSDKIKLKDVSLVLDAFGDAVGEILEKGDSVKLNKIGTIRVVTKRPRMIYKPLTDERCIINERRRIEFRPYSALKDKVKQ